VHEDKLLVVRNGVDLELFRPENRLVARRRFGFSEIDKVIVSAGWLIERKGFHRLIPLFADLVAQEPNLKLLIAGSGATQEDLGPALRMQAQQLGVSERIVFCGAVAPDQMRWCYSAGDIFALATSHEGWANVFLEAMACGLPVITTDVGGNPQVVSDPTLGRIVPYWQPEVFRAALEEALVTNWDRSAIVAHARRHDWSEPVGTLVHQFEMMANE
jgi:glycosyltransferase involved in cell wall biosynthesis